MAIKNNDDVAHLQEATGRAGSSYREFDSSADQMSAPLIDAVFGRDPPGPPQEGQPLAVDASTNGDLLADVFDRPVPLAAPKPPEPPSWRDEAIAVARAPTLPPPVPVVAAPRRSLDDIRRIITQPAERAAEPPAADGLHGLFDRLAG